MLSVIASHISSKESNWRPEIRQKVFQMLETEKRNPFGKRNPASEADRQETDLLLRCCKLFLKGHITYTQQQILLAIKELEAEGACQKVTETVDFVSSIQGNV